MMIVALAGIALMAVAAWLGEVGKNNKMFFFPMAFMLCATITSLIITVKSKLAILGSASWGDWFQLIFAASMIILAIILIMESVKILPCPGWKKSKSYRIVLPE